MSSQLLIGQESRALEAWVRLLRGHTALRRSLNASLQEQHGLGINEFEALLLLSRAENGLLRRVDMAERLQLTPSGVTRLLAGLERAGLVDKATCSSDARVTYAVLTAAGKVKLREASAPHTAAIEALFEERYTSEELETLAELLGRLPGAPIACDA
jgi:DNA-binding MarR family transcriptional regulator